MTDLTPQPRSRLLEIVDLMDAEEQRVFSHTLYLMNVAKSKSWRRRRLNEYLRWFHEKNGTAEVRA
ncbi:hypothetical protein [Paracoccus ravus]|uniref:hypothetical protein n=1 Tax=Paracoccus ravus TaxID=2447760 RepID=UPI00106DD92B|nr:hypothetical protein [Paracoccus ravus]